MNDVKISGRCPKCDKPFGECACNRMTLDQLKAMTPTNTPSPAAAREEKTPHSPLPWYVLAAEQSSNKVQKIVSKGSGGFVASLGYVGKGSRDANAAYIVEACNAHPVLTARIAALEKELEEERLSHKETKEDAERAVGENGRWAMDLQARLTAAREKVEAAKALNAKKTKALEEQRDCLLAGLNRISAMRSKWSYEKISSYRESNNTGDVEQAASEMESNYFADIADEILKTYSTI